MIFNGLFKNNILYAKLFKNGVEFLDIQNGEKLREKSNTEFSSSRLLIADFVLAEIFLKEVLKRFETKSYTSIVVHPMEIIEDGISKVEERVFIELFERLGGRLVKVHVGEILNDKQIIEKLNN